jgi:hypothetical protein
LRFNITDILVQHKSWFFGGSTNHGNFEKFTWLVRRLTQVGGEEEEIGFVEDLTAYED